MFFEINDNGNISTTFWQIAGRAMQCYDYKYDDLNRITEGNYYDINTSNNQVVFEPNKFTEKIPEYDLRGNIKKLYRTGFKEPGFNGNNDVVGNYGEIDNLTYTYDPNDLNRIRKIADGTSTISTTKGFRFVNSSDLEDYKYDDNGNLKYDKNKSITNITYNYLNLPETIQIQAQGSNNLSKILFVYDASGYKHRKIARAYTASTLTSETITDYVSGYEYVVSTTNGTFANPENSILERVHHAEGAITKQAGSAIFQYEYVLRDHLGNTRVTFKDKDNNGTIDYSNVDASINEVSQINHYYPFGLNMEGNWNGASGNNKYTYNGKELNSDFGLDWLDYGARFYDPAIARWLSPDPFSEKYINLSPYNYVDNNPVKYIDPNGKEIIIHYLNEQGKAASYTFKSGVKPTTSNVFVQKAYEAISFSMKYDKSNTLGSIIKASNKVNVYYRSMDGSHGPTDETSFSLQNKKGNFNPPYYQENGNLKKLDATIYWDPFAMVIPSDGGGISPTTNLFHEFVHALEKMGLKTLAELMTHIKNGKMDDPENRKKYGKDYDTPEEKRTIDIENEYVNEVNNATTDPTQKQAVRKTHHGEKKKTDDINSIKPKE